MLSGIDGRAAVVILAASGRRKNGFLKRIEREIDSGTTSEAPDKISGIISKEGRRFVAAIVTVEISTTQLRSVSPDITIQAGWLINRENTCAPRSSQQD